MKCTNISDLNGLEGLVNTEFTLWPAYRYVLSPNDLLLELAGRPICKKIRALFVIGAFRFEEKSLLDKVFPNLKSICLFEPMPESFRYLQGCTQEDGRIRVFPYAISDIDGEAIFNITNNRQFSSLLELAMHRDVFPEVVIIRQVPVQARRLETVIAEYELDPPDMLFMDTQGAENRIVSSLSSKLLSAVSLIYTEASTEELYQQSGTVENLRATLRDTFDYLGFGPTRMSTPTHGNALFSRKNESCHIGPLHPHDRTAADSLLALAVDDESFRKVQPYILSYLDYSFDDDFRKCFIKRQESYFKSVLSECGIKSTNYVEKAYRVSVIVSAYESEQFMGECLSDLKSQSMIDDVEIIIVDAHSPQNEGRIVQEFQRQMSNIRYIRCPARIGIYPAWNLAVSLARGEFVIPFSTNDRLRRDACEILLSAMNDNPDVALVYGDTYLTDFPHETFESFTPSKKGMLKWPEYNFELLLRVCMVGPHPIWRRQVHQEVGYFDERFVGLGDQVFFLSVGERFDLKHIAVPTGLYWHTSDGLSIGGGVPQREIPAIRKRFLWRYRQRLELGLVARLGDRISRNDK